MICQRCTKDVSPEGIHTCSPTKGWLELEEQVAALTKERDDLQDKCNNFQNKCRAAQLQVEQLKKALQEIADCPSWAIGSLDMQRYREMTK